MAGRVTDLPIQQRLEKCKTFRDALWANCKEGDYLDALDTVQKWSLASVVAKDENNVRCHFDGWSSKWDQNYRWGSGKIAPFRKYSRGYSGQ